MCAIDENGHQTLTKFTGRPVFDKNCVPLSARPKNMPDATTLRKIQNVCVTKPCNEFGLMRHKAACVGMDFIKRLMARVKCVPAISFVAKTPKRPVRTIKSVRCIPKPVQTAGDAGNYKSGADKAQCTRCPKRHYCPNGKEKSRLRDR